MLRSTRANSGTRPMPTASSRSEQLAIVLQQLVRGQEPFDAQPWMARRRAHQCHGRMTHLVASIHIEGALCALARLECARVVIPAVTGAEFLCIRAQLCGRVFLRIRGN